MVSGSSNTDTAQRGFGFVEVHSLTATMVTADAMLKAADVRLAGYEQNTSQGVGIKVTGSASAVATSVEAGVEIAQQMNCYLAHASWANYAVEADELIHAPQEFNALMSSFELMLPGYAGRPAWTTAKGKSTTMATEYAIGLIETQGFVGLLEAADAMCKAADVEIIGKEKLGGGFITVIVRGNVAAVRAAVESGAAACTQVGGKLILSHVIARPHGDIKGLLPQ